MGRYCLNTNQTKGIKKALKKWGQIVVDDENFKGVITIKNVRKYPAWHEADVELKGMATFNYNRKKTLYPSEIQKTQGVSKIKINRILRKYTFQYVSMRLKYFDVDLRDTYNIKKITWL
jgi:hypothetical protein